MPRETNWDKVVNGATKAKRAPPKAKYIDMIVDGCSSPSDFFAIRQALYRNLRDNDATVVIKALIVTHTILRAAPIESVYGKDMGGLDLREVGREFSQPIMNAYAVYLDARLKSYDSLRHDYIRETIESHPNSRNRRGSFEVSGQGSRNIGGAGNRLRKLHVEKGLLRETKVVMSLMGRLIKCEFRDSERDDDIDMTVLRLLVKDILVLFQVVNEAVINILEHYFEMTHVDASTALDIYKDFCRQTRKVVDYLGSAKKMQGVIGVQIPNMKHAPVSLASALEEYLNDPEFEKNRREYENNKRIADGKPPRPASPTSAPVKEAEQKPSTSTATQPSSSTSASAATNSTPAKASAPNKDFTDFFSSIEQETTMFNPQTGSPNTSQFQQAQYVQPQATGYNPFLQAQMTGMSGAGGMGPMGMMGGGAGGMVPQATGFPAAFGAAAFGSQPQQQPMQNAFTGVNAFGNQQQQQQPFVQSQPTGFIQPQATGFNPFRQSMIMPQVTGFAMGGVTSSPFTASGNAPPIPALPSQSQPFMGQGQSNQVQSNSSSSPNNNAAQSASSTSTNIFAIDPKTGAAPIKAQKTGSRNPFAPPPGSEPPVPKLPPGPSMNSLAAQAFGQQQQPQMQQPFATGMNAFAGQGQPQSFSGSTNQNQTSSLGAQAGGGLMASVASEFVKPSSPAPNTSNQQNANNPASVSMPSPHPFQPSGLSSFSNLSVSIPSSNTSDFTASPIAAQPTGFGGSMIKPFKPSSNFGASLNNSLPPLLEQPTGMQLTSSATGTGGLAANPFRASTLGSTPTGVPNGLAQQTTGFPAFSSQQSAFTPNFGAFNGTSQGQQQASTAALF